ncbi:MAG TPA: DUF1775 domain-containing protein [Sphingomicrobium sp.]|nr:DUF1775 domain-containing protein [Sphingomicrobium sp.]
MRSILILLACLAAAPASAHVTIWPKESAAGMREKYEVRMPDEKPVDTVALELHVPAGVKLDSVEQKPGWQSAFMRDGSGAIIGVRWSGRLEPMHFVEFGLIATNPPAASELVWNATQLFADGSKVEWSGVPGSKTPAPRVSLGARARD